MFPVRIVVPEPIWLKTPLPLMSFEIVMVLLRLTASVPLSTTLPDPRLPVVPLLPICKVPDVIVVVPV